jgi:hypothetical protein
MPSKLSVDAFSSETETRSFNDIYGGSAKLMIQYNTTYSPYSASIEKSHGVSSVVDIQTGIQDIYPSLSLGNTRNRRPCLPGVSTNLTAVSFGYHGCLYTGTAFRFAYYTSGWAAAQYISVMGF